MYMTCMITIYQKHFAKKYFLILSYKVSTDQQLCIEMLDLGLYMYTYTHTRI